MARIDSVKGLCSSTELEAILTSKVINGHRIHKGDASRPNNLTFIFTGNALTLSTDLTRRTFTINMTKPMESEDWEGGEAVHNCKPQAHLRSLIYADIIAKLRNGTGGWRTRPECPTSRGTRRTPPDRGSVPCSLRFVLRVNHQVGTEHDQSKWFPLVNHGLMALLGFPPWMHGFLSLACSAKKNCDLSRTPLATRTYASACGCFRALASHEDASIIHRGFRAVSAIAAPAAFPAVPNSSLHQSSVCRSRLSSPPTPAAWSR